MAVERSGVATRSITIAVAGNPNCGKTTIFNNFTGLRQHIANYPGVTVETKAGEFMHGSTLVRVVDLPGTYSLTTYSEEEIETRNFFLRHRPDVVIDVVDATNIERNLFLTTHLLELNIPIVIALNMADEARQRGIEFSISTLESLLGVQVVPTIGSRKEGMKELLEAALQAPERWKTRREIKVNYGHDIETELENVETLLDERPDMTAKAEKRWVAVKLIEGDPEIVSQASAGKLIENAVEGRGRIETLFADSIETVMADRRYGFISGACREAVRETATSRHTFSDTLDEIMTHNTFGLPILLALMYLLFYLTFTVGAPGVSFLEWLIGKTGSLISSFWPKGSESMLKSLLVDGVIGGVGGVIVFVPNIMLLFFGLAIPRGFRIYGTGGLYHGPPDAQDRPSREKLYPYDDRVRLQYPGDHGHPDARQSSRPPDNHVDSAPDKLRRPPADLRPVYPGIFPSGLAGPGTLVNVHNRNPVGGCHGANTPQNNPSPDIVIGCAGGGSNFAGLAFPYIRHRLEGKDIRFVAVEPRSCPTMSRGTYSYDFGDTTKLTPLLKMLTLGHTFVPPGIHAGGLRYHGMAPMVSLCAKLGIVEAAAFHQLECFAAAQIFAKTEGIIPAPETSHAIRATIVEAEKCRESGEEKCIVMSFSGHGLCDLGAYDRYFAGELDDHSYAEEKLAEAMADLPQVD